MRCRLQELPGTQIIPFCTLQRNIVEDPAPVPNGGSLRFALSICCHDV